MNEDKSRKKDPMEGITLKMMLADVIDYFGFQDIYTMTEIKSFNDDYPQFNKILKFIRKTPWAKDKIEKMFRGNIDNIAQMRKELPRDFDKF